MKEIQRESKKQLKKKDEILNESKPIKALPIKNVKIKPRFIYLIALKIGLSF